MKKKGVQRTDHSENEKTKREQRYCKMERAKRISKNRKSRETKRI